jgi:hypothetical protein
MTTGRINQGAARGPRAPPEEGGGAAGGPRGALGHGRASRPISARRRDPDAVTTAAPRRERPPRYANGLPDSFK